MESELVIEIQSNIKIIKGLYKALLPESLNPPSEECKSSICENGDKLVITIQCSRVNLLRAVANSYLSIISMILRTIEGLKYE